MSGYGEREAVCELRSCLGGSRVLVASCSFYTLLFLSLRTTDPSVELPIKVDSDPASVGSRAPITVMDAFHATLASECSYLPPSVNVFEPEPALCHAFTRV